MILGTSICLSKSGPGDLPIIFKMLHKIQEKYGIILEKYYLCQSGTQNNYFVFQRNCMSWVPSFSVFPDFVGLFVCLWNVGTFFEKIVEMRIENEKLSIKNICKSLDMNFISIKSMKYKFGKSSKLIYFRVRESPFCLFSTKGIIQY